MTEDKKLHLQAVEDNLRSVQAENSILRCQVSDKHSDNVKLWELINRLAETNQKLSTLLERGEYSR